MLLKLGLTTGTAREQRKSIRLFTSSVCHLQGHTYKHTHMPSSDLDNHCLTYLHIVVMAESFLKEENSGIILLWFCPPRNWYLVTLQWEKVYSTTVWGCLNLCWVNSLGLLTTHSPILRICLQAKHTWEPRIYFWALTCYAPSARYQADKRVICRKQRLRNLNIE